MTKEETPEKYLSIDPAQTVGDPAGMPAAAPEAKTIPDGMIKTVIIEDDPVSVGLLRDELSHCSWIRVTGDTATVSGAAELLESQSPDLIFLDIELDDGSGLDIMEEMDRLVAPHTKVVFYTAYPRYMIKALRMQAFDFLLKPIDPEELGVILERFRLKWTGRAMPLHMPLPSLDQPVRPEEDSKRAITIGTLTNERVIVAPADIVYFRYDTEHKTWVAMLRDMKRYVLRREVNADTLVSLSRHFVRTHRTYIVNISYLAAITNTECRLLPPYHNISEIKISRAYRRPLLDCFFEL